jgi:hypothetical protein
VIATGNDEYGEQLAESASASSSSTRTRTAAAVQPGAIGPSEVGEPCERQLSYKILDWPETNTNRDPIAAIIGTGFHMWMAEKFEARQAPMPDGQPRYRIEERVTVRQGPTEASTLTGSSDLFDRLGSQQRLEARRQVSSHDKYRRQGPGEKYRIQAHLYGLGQENAGHRPARVAVTFIGRHHELMVHVWSEPYDRQHRRRAGPARPDPQHRSRPGAGPPPGELAADPIPEKPNCRFCPGSSPAATTSPRAAPAPRPPTRAPPSNPSSPEHPPARPRPAQEQEHMTTPQQQYQAPSADDFLMGGGGAPSAKFPTVGTTVSGRITERPTVEQQRDTRRREQVLARREPDDAARRHPRRPTERDPSSPTTTARRRLFVKGQMKNAVADAVRAAGARGLEVGGVLTVTYTHGTATQRGFSPPKQYTAQYTAAAPPSCTPRTRAPSPRRSSTRHLPRQQYAPTRRWSPGTRATSCPA